MGFEPVEAAREARLTSSAVLPPKMALPAWLELGGGLMQVPVYRKRERGEIWASSVLHFLLSDVEVTHPPSDHNSWGEPSVVAVPSPKGLWEMQTLTGPSVCPSKMCLLGLPWRSSG